MKPQAFEFLHSLSQRTEIVKSPSRKLVIETKVAVEQPCQCKVAMATLVYEVTDKGVKQVSNYTTLATTPSEAIADHCRTIDIFWQGAVEATFIPAPKN